MLTYRHWLATLSLVILANQIQAQNGSSISGIVRDASSGLPLHFANVFLANTTMGDATNEEGKYLIRHVSPGVFEIVASMQGYEIAKKTVKTGKDQVALDFNLKPKVLSGGEVTVFGQDPVEWRRNLAIFEKIFFGVKDFAEQCQLLNPEMLNFEFERGKGRFNAFAEQPVRFINRALGYEVTVVLETFAATLTRTRTSLIEVDNICYRKEDLAFSGSIHFKELQETDERRKKEWAVNRAVAYNGSRRHFLEALWKSELKENGFKIRGAKLVILHGQKMFSPEAEYGIKATDLLKPGQLPNQRLVYFPDYLKVTYKNERDLIEYKTRMKSLEESRENRRLSFPNRPGFSNQDYIAQKRAIIEQASANQTSWLKINGKKPVVVLKNGTESSTHANLIAYGYWYWDSADEWLPTDYSPKK